MEGKYIVMSHQYVYNNICMPAGTTNGYNYFISAATSPANNAAPNLIKMWIMRIIQQSWGKCNSLFCPHWRAFRSQKWRLGKLIGYFSKIYTLYTSQQGTFNSQFILRLLLVGDSKYFSKLFFRVLEKTSDFSKGANWGYKTVLWIMLWIGD